MKYKIEFDFPDNEIVITEIKTEPVKWSVWGYSGYALATPVKPTVSGWIPFVRRPLTDDKQKIHPGWCYILEGNVPKDEEEILLYRPWRNSKGYIIVMDTYMDNGNECYLEGAGDIENGMFWMPLPKPPKENEDD